MTNIPAGQGGEIGGDHEQIQYETTYDQHVEAFLRQKAWPEDLAGEAKQRLLDFRELATPGTPFVRLDLIEGNYELQKGGVFDGPPALNYLFANDSWNMTFLYHRRNRLIQEPSISDLLEASSLAGEPGIQPRTRFIFGDEAIGEYVRERPLQLFTAAPHEIAQAFDSDFKRLYALRAAGVPAAELRISDGDLESLDTWLTYRLLQDPYHHQPDETLAIFLYVHQVPRAELGPFVETLCQRLGANLPDKGVDISKLMNVARELAGFQPLYDPAIRNVPPEIRASLLMAGLFMFKAQALEGKATPSQRSVVKKVTIKEGFDGL